MEKEEELASVSKKKEAPLILMEEGQINSFVHVYNNIMSYKRTSLLAEMWLSRLIGW